uniref:NADH dehydrogenase subunit 5 n=1 Tax=Podonevadne trigona TaxID=141406 RepID=UPI002E777F1B|nr:NADH dehydrogenase subunit 5 [Podonevadne trigona]WPT28349.1 NADH dehydrogenase subunit 5 [Podonevadne trigona]
MFQYFYKKISFFLFNMSFLSFLAGVNFMMTNSITFIEWVIGGSTLCFHVTFLIDAMSLVFLAVVLFISGNVVYYSQSYMTSDPYADRFIMLVFGFIISMFLLVISPNIVSILLGWDGLGLVSYCLVIYYPTKKSNSAGMLTVMSNRVGDICILLIIAWMGALGDFSFVPWTMTEWMLTETNTLSILVVLAAITKSAQFPFSAWLPAAMAAPTPVSALVHSSTLVTAGVYLLIRFSECMTLSSSTLLMFLSTVTMFLSGLVANFEYDMKKIIALSTLSQLGVMMFSISLGLYGLAFFHLVIHALFKALLFLCAGVLIHGVGGSQDIRLCGGLARTFPLIGVCMNLANLSLCGLPFLSGFYSKDLIIEMAAQGAWNQLVILILFIAVGLTVTYTFRLVYLSFVGWTSGLSSTFFCDTDMVMMGPIVNLTVVALLSGPTLAWLLFPFPLVAVLPSSLKLLTSIIIILSILLSVATTSSSMNWVYSKNYAQLSNFVGSMGYLPFISGQMVPSSALVLGNQVLKTSDQGWLEHVTVSSLNFNFTRSGGILNLIQSNSLKIHFLSFLFLFLVLLVMGA